MRILALTNLYPNPQQPHRATYNRQHFREFAAAGHEVRVIAPMAWTDELAAWRRGVQRMPRNRCATLDGIAIEHPRYVYTPRVLRGMYGHFFRRSARCAFERAVAQFSPDVVFASWAYPDGWAAIQLGHAAGIPVVINVVGSDLLLCDGIRRQRLAETIQGADGIVAASNDLAERIIALGGCPSRVRTVHNGVDADLFRPGTREMARARLGLHTDKPILLFVGNLAWVKGLDVLINALEELAAGGADFLCYLIGQGPLRSELERQTALQGGGRVKLVGSIAHELLPDWFRAANVFVLPSRSEGLPNVLLEAIACGIPFVATRVGGVPEVAHLGQGRLVAPADVRALAVALAESINMSARGVAPPRTQVRSHSDAAAEIVQFCGQVVAQKDSGARANVAALALS